MWSRMKHSPTDAFIEQMGQIAQAEGLPRIAGRILGLLVVEGHAFNLDEMAARLEISKASASTNSRLLLTKHLVRRSTRRGSRQDFYEAMPSPDAKMMGELSARFQRHAETLETIGADFTTPDNDRRARVLDHARFYRETAEFLDNWGSRLAPESAPTKEQTK